MNDSIKVSVSFLNPIFFMFEATKSQYKLFPMLS
jgi:hypothetical protein